MSIKYRNIIVFSFGCNDDFENAEALRRKYRQKGYAEASFYHVVLTNHPNELTPLTQEYPHLANEILDIQTIQENNLDSLPKLQCVIQQDTKVIIHGHGRAESDCIVSKKKEMITMPQLAKLLKKNCLVTQIAITLMSCHSGLGSEINSVDPSIAKTLHTSLQEHEIEAIISAPTTLLTISPNGKKELSSVIADPDLIFISRYPNTIQEQLASLSILPWRGTRERIGPVYDWVSIRDNSQELYDIENCLIDRKFHKSLGSRVILNADGSISFPYGKFERDAVVEEESKILYAYCDQQRIYRVQARQICSQHWIDTGTENLEIEHYEGYQHLKELIFTCAYPYPGVINYLADTIIDQTKLMQFSPEKGIWEESTNLANDFLHMQEARRKMLSMAVESFKNKINTDPNLKEIRDQHTALARQTRYRLEGKNIALRDIKIGGYMSIETVIVGILTARFLPIIITFIVSIIMGSLACFILGQGLARGYNYLPIKPRSKEQEQEQEKLNDSDTYLLGEEPSNGNISICIEQEQTEISIDVSLQERGSITQNLMRHGFVSKQPPKAAAELCPNAGVELHL